jgi:UDP-glucose:(heptosyl)LPS alpha-1,3-glucosyltransferase
MHRLLKSGLTDLRLLVVGRDNPVPFRRRVGSMKLHDHVIFTGPTQRSSAFFHAADVCVHPTYYDPCSRVVLEALSLGLPCITTRHNGAAEVMQDGVEGYILDSADDVDGMADRIRRLSSATLRGEMGGSAAALRDRISMERHVSELNDVFTEFAERRRGRTKSA